MQQPSPEQDVDAALAEREYIRLVQEEIYASFLAEEYPDETQQREFLQRTLFAHRVLHGAKVDIHACPFPDCQQAHLVRIALALTDWYDSADGEAIRERHACNPQTPIPTVLLPTIDPP